MPSAARSEPKRPAFPARCMVTSPPLQSSTRVVVSLRTLRRFSGPHLQNHPGVLAGGENIRHAEDITVGAILQKVADSRECLLCHLFLLRGRGGYCPPPCQLGGPHPHVFGLLLFGDLFTLESFRAFHARAVKHRRSFDVGLRQ